MVSERVSEEILPEIDTENEEEEQNEPTFLQGEVKKMQSSRTDSIDDISNMDLYKHIVDAISLDRSLSDDQDTVSFVTSDKLFCAWETDRNCPLKMKKGTEKQLTLTFEYCVVCQLVEIKQHLKKQID